MQAYICTDVGVVLPGLAEPKEDLHLPPFVRLNTGKWEEDPIESFEEARDVIGGLMAQTAEYLSNVEYVDFDGEVPALFIVGDITIFGRVFLTELSIISFNYEEDFDDEAYIQLLSDGNEDEGDDDEDESDDEYEYYQETSLIPEYIKVFILEHIDPENPKDVCFTNTYFIPLIDCREITYSKSDLYNRNSQLLKLLEDAPTKQVSEEDPNPVDKTPFLNDEEELETKINNMETLVSKMFETMQKGFESIRQDLDVMRNKTTEQQRE